MLLYLIFRNLRSSLLNDEQLSDKVFIFFIDKLLVLVGRPDLSGVKIVEFGNRIHYHKIQHYLQCVLGSDNQQDVDYLDEPKQETLADASDEQLLPVVKHVVMVAREFRQIQQTFYFLVQ